MTRVARLVAAFLLFSAISEARVISYAPYTNRASIPAVQNRLNRHFVLIEQTPAGSSSIISPPPPCCNNPTPSQLVLYDAQGLEEPRVIFPADGSSSAISSATVREEAGVVSILIQTSANFLGANPTNQFIWLLTNDSGASWMKVAIPTTPTVTTLAADFGGPFARGRYSNVRVGTPEVPFVVGNSLGVFAVSNVGTVKQIFTSSVMSTIPLIGSDREGRRFLVNAPNTIYTVDINGNQSAVAARPGAVTIEGWITPDGAAYLEQAFSPGNVVLFYAKDGNITPVAASWDGPPNAQPPINSSWIFFAVPTSDYSGAWVMRRGGNRPTSLLLHTPTAGLVQQWQDVSAPQVEALHAAPSGTKLLVQVHRPRQSVDNLLFKDPALAVWPIGSPAPRSYDELFLSETSTKGFVHLDVDAIAGGATFVFDSGVPQPLGGGVIISPAPPSAGGSDVVQEWGVVRGSLRQQQRRVVHLSRASRRRQHHQPHLQQGRQRNLRLHDERDRCLHRRRSTLSADVLRRIRRGELPHQRDADRRLRPRHRSLRNGREPEWIERNGSGDAHRPEVWQTQINGV